MNRKLVDNHGMYKCAKFQMDQIQDGRLAAIFLLNLAENQNFHNLCDPIIIIYIHNEYETSTQSLNVSSGNSICY